GSDPAPAVAPGSGASASRGSTFAAKRVEIVIPMRSAPEAAGPTDGKGAGGAATPGVAVIPGTPIPRRAAAPGVPGRGAAAAGGAPGGGGGAGAGGGGRKRGPRPPSRRGPPLSESEMSSRVRNESDSSSKLTNLRRSA